jgi:cyclopropane-fatty-acyl-phospholipid synthase
MSSWGWGIALAERGWIPDTFIRRGIRRLCAQRLQELEQAAAQNGTSSSIANSLPELPLAVQTDQANEQHYELPPEYFELMLGSRRKYSCCYWDETTSSLDQAEANALERVCANAGIVDGQRILDLGCGWGSLTLWLAEHYPGSTIVGVSNSTRQRAAILQQCTERNFNNVEIVTLDVGKSELLHLDKHAPFDRVVSIEMIEHVRNHRLLLEQLSSLLADDGALYFHFFCHDRHAYLFEEQSDTDWMTQYFFRGGMMPARSLMQDIHPRLQLAESWVWPGRHYQRTAEAWLARHDAKRREIMEIFIKHYGSREAERWFQRWRIFYLSVAELFGYRQGQEWYVTHCLLKKNAAAVAPIPTPRVNEGVQA